MAGIPIIQIRGSSAVVYSERLFSSAHSRLFARQNMSKIRKGRYSGRMTEGARKRLSKAICLLVQSAKPSWITNTVTGRLHYHRLSFITLTIASDKNITARQGYDLLLNHFLDWLTRTKGVKSFIWKAELQTRGQLHYHITVPNFIDHREIRDKWNELQHRAGLLDGFFQKFGHYKPPSTDIADVRKVRNMERYLIKELAKSIDARLAGIRKKVSRMVYTGEIDAADAKAKTEELMSAALTTEGRLWGCSNNLSKGKYFDMVLENRHDDKINQWKAAGNVREVRGDFFSILYFEDIDIEQLFDPSERKRFHEHIRGICQ